MRSLVIVAAAMSFAGALVVTSSGCGAAGSGDAPDDDAEVDEPSAEDSGSSHGDARADGGKTTPTDSGGGHADTHAGVDTTPTPTPPAAADTSPPPSTDDLQRCVDLINVYRAKVSKKPLGRSSALETFAAAGAQADSKTGSAHGHFISTSGGGIAWAENEIPGWPLESSGVRGVLEDGLQMMWDEGPGGGHHDNMASTEYTEVGCGVFVTSGKEVWIVQDFR